MLNNLRLLKICIAMYSKSFGGIKLNALRAYVENCISIQHRIELNGKYSFVRIKQLNIEF